MRSTNSSGNSMIVGIVIIVIVLLIGAGVWNYSVKPDTELETVTTTPNPDTTIPVASPLATTTPAVVNNPPVSAMMYKNGSYSATGSYNSPGGAESIDVTLVVKDDMVTDATVVSNATLPNSKKLQGIFISNFKTQVIGKSIDALNLTKVSGSSLTPKGFNDALSKIKAEARV